MTATTNANEYAADLAIPFEPGTDTVTVNVTVTASDYLNNARSSTAPVQITPKFDPTAPVVTWNCGASGAIVPPGATVTLSVTAIPGSTGTAIFQVVFNDGTKFVPEYRNWYLPVLPVGPGSPDENDSGQLSSQIALWGAGVGSRLVQVTVSPGFTVADPGE